MNAIRAIRLPSLALMLGGFWLWAIWSCAGHWQSNPNYSYGWAVPALVLAFVFRRAALQREPQIIAPASPAPFISILIVIAAAVIVFLLEFARVQIWHPQFILWSICLLVTASTLAAFRFFAGRPLARATFFPIAFFLTAVPWPPRFEQPVTAALMQWVARVTVELLHWLGLDAQLAGAAIALPAGLVGITEACSGIRSLQAAIMFGLAMGEWFLLRWPRRVALLFLSILLALASNLARTLALSLQAASHGIAAVERVHDLIGNITVTAMIVAIWLAGKILSARHENVAAISPVDLVQRGHALFQRLFLQRPAFFLSILAASLLALFSARAVDSWIEIQDRTQTSAFFLARTDSGSGNQLLKIPPEIWNELQPTSGEYVRRESGQLPGGAADCFHFFWKPSPWNRFALIHRPDICMPGIGWEQTAPPEMLHVDLNGNRVQLYAFHFRRGQNYALELWGIWRNGEPISLDYGTAQVFGVAPPPAALHLEGKRRSATEIVACSVIGENSEPAREIAVAVLRSAFEYKIK